MYRDFKNIAFKQRSVASNIDIRATGSCLAVIPTVDIHGRGYVFTSVPGSFLPP